MQFEKMIKT